MSRTRLGLMAVGTLTALLLTGCGGGAADGGAPTKAAEGGSASGSASSTTGDAYSQIEALPKDQQRAKAEELAKKEGQLSLYTSMTEDVATAVTKAFTEQTGVPVQLFRGNSETVLQRVSQEASAGKLGADAVETNFAEMAAMSDQGVLRPFGGASKDAVDKNGQFPNWTATRFNIFMPAWNTDLIKPGDEPQSWEALADPKYKGKITMEISDSDWYENVTKWWLDHGKTQAQVDDLWKKIVDNSVAAKGHTTMMQLLGAGQSAMDAMNYSYITYKAAKKGAPVAYLPASGKSDIPAFARPNGVGEFKDAQHKAAAWLFYDWLLTDGQKVLVDQGLSPSTKVPGDKSLDGVNLQPYDVETLRKSGDEWEKKYDALLRGVKKVDK
ncbi:MAG: ABC transporter substrate-binding protein [Actinomycetales bacterium]